VAVRSLSALGRTVPTDTAQSLSLSAAAADVYDNDDVGDGDSGPPSSAYTSHLRAIAVELRRRWVFFRDIS